MIEVLIRKSQLYADNGQGQRYPLHRLDGQFGHGWENSSDLLRDKKAWEEFLNG